MSKGLLGREVKRKERIKHGEEKLHEVYPIKVVDEHRMLIAGEDGGSTGTRVCLTDGEDKHFEFSEIFQIPSVWGKKEDNEELIPMSENLNDKLDAIISDTTGDRVNSMIGKLRSIRGGKLENSKVIPAKITSTILKIEDQTFYLNLVESLAYACVQKYKGVIPAEISVYAGVALPPGEQISTRNRDKFRDNIVGTYTVHFTDYNASMKVNILDAITLTEPEACAHAYQLTECDDEEAPKYSIHIDCGGRSIGIALLIDGKSAKDRCKTLEFGGTQLASSLGDALVDNYGGKKPSQELLSLSLETGEIKFSKIPADITDEIKKVKNDMADDIYQGITDLLSEYGKVPFEAIERVTISGGLVRSGEYDYSVADRLLTRLCNMNDAIEDEFIVLEENYIPLGMLISAYAEFEDVFEKATTEE